MGTKATVGGAGEPAKCGGGNGASTVEEAFAGEGGDARRGCSTSST